MLKELIKVPNQYRSSHQDCLDELNFLVLLKDHYNRAELPDERARLICAMADQRVEIFRVVRDYLWGEQQDVNRTN